MKPPGPAMDERRRQLGLRWRDVADKAALSEETIRVVRNGGRDNPVRTTDTEARIERALGWTKGSIKAIREGAHPTPLPGTPDGSPLTPHSSPDLVTTDPGYRAIWEIPDELLHPAERRYAITQIELLRLAKHTWPDH